MFISVLNLVFTFLYGYRCAMGFVLDTSSYVNVSTDYQTDSTPVVSPSFASDVSSLSNTTSFIGISQSSTRISTTSYINNVSGNTNTSSQVLAASYTNKFTGNSHHTVVKSKPNGSYIKTSTKAILQSSSVLSSSQLQTFYTQPLSSTQMVTTTPTQPLSTTQMINTTPTQPSSSTQMMNTTPTQPSSSTQMMNTTPTQPSSSTQMMNTIPTQPLSLTKMITTTSTQQLSLTHMVSTAHTQPLSSTLMMNTTSTQSLSAIQIMITTLPNHSNTVPTLKSVQMTNSYSSSNLNYTISPYTSTSAIPSIVLLSVTGTRPFLLIKNPTNIQVSSKSIQNIHPTTSVKATILISNSLIPSSSSQQVTIRNPVSSSISSRTASVSPSVSTAALQLTVPATNVAPTPSGGQPTVSQSSMPACVYTRTCCVHGLRQMNATIFFKESLQPGSVLAAMKAVWNVSMTVIVASPIELLPVLRDYFTIVNNSYTTELVLKRELDLEDVYLRANQKKDVHKFQLQINCLEHGRLYPSRLINVTVEDVDDSMPVFQHDGSGPSCVVPVYIADTDEDYTGELSISPGRIRAVDGDLTQKNNVTYKIMHSEPDDYHQYFHVDAADGTVNKTRTMNASDPRKFVLFVQATEDSPNKKNRVAILSIDVYAPLADSEDPVTVDPAVTYALQIISALVLLAFASGFLVIIHHRYRQRKVKVDHTKSSTEEQDVRIPKLAVYKSSSSSLNSLIPDIPVITSPSQISMKPKQKVFQKQKKIIIKKPLDTSARPGWNAPTNKAKRVTYNPYVAVQKVKKQ